MTTDKKNKIAGPFDSFATDQDLEIDGIWIDYGDFRIKLARAGGNNMAYKKAMEKRTKPYRSSIQRGTMNEKVAQKILVDVFVATVILDWDSPKLGAGKLAGKEGQPLQFNNANATQLMVELPDLFADLRAQAEDASLFAAEIRETDAKN